MLLLPERRIVALWRSHVAIYQYGELQLGGPFDDSPPPSEPLWVYEFDPAPGGVLMVLSPPLLSPNVVRFAFRTGTNMVLVRVQDHYPSVTEVPVGIQPKNLQLTMGAYRGLWWEAPVRRGQPFRVGCITYGHTEGSTAVLREFGGLEALPTSSEGAFEIEVDFLSPENLDGWTWLFDEQSGRVVIPVKSLPTSRVVLDFA